ncbi:hypothetical protein [Nocardia sp. NPDC004711]
MTGISVAPVRIPGLRGEQAREWRQFACRAAAAELPALPTTTDTVLAYLAENPGTPATQRGRVSALDAAHKAKQMPIPGAAEAVRRALNPGRRNAWRACVRTRTRSSHGCRSPAGPTR